MAGSPWVIPIPPPTVTFQPIEAAVVGQDRDEAQVLREHVDVVVGRDGDHRLELPRQVGLAVDRLVLGLTARDLLALEPDLAVGAGLRQQVLADPSASSSASPWARLTCGFGVHITLRLTSPQAAIVSRQARSIACIVRFRFCLMTPWNCQVCRVVSRSVPLAKSPAIWSICSHCCGVHTPPGRRTRAMNAKAGSISFLRRSGRRSRSSWR